MEFDKCFQGKKILVTGAGRGIGRAIAVALHSRGAKVYAVSRTLDTLETLKAELPNIIPICVELSDWDATRKALEPLERMDCVINNAGICESCPFLDITPELFDRTANTNLKSVINVSQVTAGKMIEEKVGGRIVNITSLFGKKGSPTFGVYSSLKAGLEMLSHVMAIELGPLGITVNNVAPGMVDTPMVQKLFDPEQMKQFKDVLSERTPTRKFMNPMEDVVNSVLFFASGITSNVTGVSLMVDGGFSIG